MEVWGLSVDGASVLRESGAPAFLEDEAGGERYLFHPGEGARVQVIEGAALDVAGLGLRPAAEFLIAEGPPPASVVLDLPGPGLGPHALSLKTREGRGGDAEWALVLADADPQANADPAREVVAWRASGALRVQQVRWFRAGEHLYAELRTDDAGAGVRCAVAVVELRRLASAKLEAQGVRMLREDKAAQARGVLERAVEVAPENATAAYNLACALALEGERDAALEWLERALMLDDDGRLRLLARRDPDLAAVRESDRPRHREKFRALVGR